jgi:hypothetical protein
VEATMKTIPKDATHWSVRPMATSQKVSPATVLRIWKKPRLQPHRVESFKIRTDPDFAPEVRDIVGLYIILRIGRILLSVDEQSRIQGSVDANDYKCHGTATLFAALNVLKAEQ